MSCASVLHKHNRSMNHLGALLYWFGFSSWYGTWEFSFLQDPTWCWYCSSIDLVAVQPKLFALRFTTSQLLSWTASTVHHSDPCWKSNLPWGVQVADSLPLWVPSESASAFTQRPRSACTAPKQWVIMVVSKHGLSLLAQTGPLCQTRELWW